MSILGDTKILKMSKSYKKNPYTGFTTAKSEKFDKITSNRKLRQKEKNILKSIDNLDEAEDIILPDIREVSNVWNFAKDGKMYHPKGDEYYNKAIRK